MGELNEYKLVDSNFVNVLKKEVLKMQKCKEKTFGTNFKKKLDMLIILMINELLSLSEMERSDSIFLSSKITRYLITLGANYFSHESLQILRIMAQDNEQLDLVV